MHLNRFFRRHCEQLGQRMFFVPRCALGSNPIFANARSAWSMVICSVI
jgi:hypothetical protein